jgi:hypothetical protein
MTAEPCADLPRSQPKTARVYLRRDRDETRPDFEYVARKTQPRVFERKLRRRFEPAEGHKRQTQRRPELAKGQVFRGQ